MRAKFTFPLFSIAFAFACSSGSSESTSTDSSNNEAVLAAVKAEPKVKDATITDANVLYVGVVDDGTKRDGYADYLCQVAKEKGRDLFKVRVMKVNSFDDPNRYDAYGVLLGESSCN